MALKYWTEKELREARRRGAEIAAYLRANAAPCLRGCHCGVCGGDPAKQEATPTDGADSATGKGQDHQSSREQKGFAQ